MPLATTPMDKQAAQGLRNHARKMEKALRDMTPWKRRKVRRALRRAPNKKVSPGQSGEVVVILDHVGEAQLPIFKGAQTQMAGESKE